jgi:hypothetical protein
MGYLTRDQITQKLANISAAMDAAMAGQSYSLDDGHGRISVTRASLPGLRDQYEFWQNELDKLDNPNADIVSVQVGR